MTLIFIGENAVPAYTALESDIVGDAIAGANLIGKLVYLMDTKKWKVIEPDLTLSDYQLPVTKVGYADTGSLDAFSRLRVSTPKTIFNSAFRYDLQPLLFKQQTVTGGTISHSADNSSASLILDATGGGSCILQSRQYHRYIPAKSHLIAMTQVMGDAVDNVLKRAGYFDCFNSYRLC